MGNFFISPLIIASWAKKAYLQKPLGYTRENMSCFSCHLINNFSNSISVFTFKLEYPFPQISSIISKNPFSNFIFIIVLFTSGFRSISFNRIFNIKLLIQDIKEFRINIIFKLGTQTILLI